MVHRRYGCALIWPRPSTLPLPHWCRDGCDGNIHTDSSGRQLRAANQAGARLRLHVRRHELLGAMALTYFCQSNGRPSWNSFESGQVWKMVTSSHHLHIMKAKLNGQTQLHAIISKICCCGFSLLEYIFIFVISEVRVKTKMSQSPSLKWRKSELLPSTANKVDIWQYCVFYSSTLCWCLFVAAVSTFICFFLHL